MADAAEAEATRQHLILTELFGVHPRAMVDALVVSANEHLYTLGTQLEDDVRAQLDGVVDDPATAAEQHAIDHTMDTFELYCLRSIFVVTPAQSRLITLSHHRGLDLRAPDDGADADTTQQDALEHTTDEERQLQRRLACARATQHRLAQAEVAAQVRLARAQAVAQAFAFVSEGRQSMDSGSQDAPLEHVADDIASQVYGVLEAVDQLRAAAPLHVPLLAAPLPGGAADKHEWDQGRDEYLNWEAQRIMGALKRQAT